MSDSPPPPFRLPDPDAFKRPPITRREAQIWFNVTQEDFDLKVPSLISHLEEKGQFTEKKVKEFWEFKVEVRQGKMAKPKVSMTQIPELRRPNGISLTLQLAPPIAGQAASLTLIQPYSDHQPARFQDLLAECTAWAPEVLAHFGVTDATRVTLAYRNEITKERYPDIWVSDREIRLGNMLCLFRGMPNPHPAVLAVGFLIDYTREYLEHPGCTLRVKLNSEPTPLGTHLWAATFVFESRSERLDGHGITAAFVELAAGHGAVYSEFCTQFTPGALELFAK